MKELFQEANLAAAGTHTGLDVLENDQALDREMDYQRTIGTRWIICPSVPEARRRTLEGWQQLAQSFNRIGERCAAAGLRFGYHNHAFEFAPIAGTGEGAPWQCGLDVILEETDPQLVFWEPDVYWIHKGGASPVALIQQHAGRVPITHLKDVTDDERQTFAEVGEGALPWPDILAAFQAAGAEWHCVEQDRCDRPPLESVKISLHNLRSWGMGLPR
jgi:sugar phosphate isomerase/epimerase